MQTQAGAEAGERRKQTSWLRDTKKLEKEQVYKLQGKDIRLVMKGEQQ